MFEGDVIRSKKAWIWVAVPAMVLCGIILCILLSFRSVGVPKLLIGTKKPVHIWERSTKLISYSFGQAVVSRRETKTLFYIEDTQPEQVIEAFASESAIGSEHAFGNYYSCRLGAQIYEIMSSSDGNNPGALVFVTEIESPVSPVDSLISRFAPGWANFRYGSMSVKRPAATPVKQLPILDLVRIKRARPNTTVSKSI